MMKRSKIKQIIVLLLSLSMIFSSVTVFASGRTGALVIDFHGRKGEETKIIPLAGAEFTIRKAGEMKAGKWELTGEFADAGIALDDLSASGQRETAEQLYYYARMNRISGKKQKTDKAGMARYGNLEEGLYLAVQETDLQEEDGVWRSAPFLFSMPMDDEYEVKAQPKSEWVANEQRIQIGLRDLTIYTGGNELTGEIDGFPTPRYTGIPEEVSYEVNGEPWNTQEKGYPFHVLYTWGEESPDLTIEDTMQYMPEDTEPGLYVAHVVPKQMGSVITATDSSGKNVRVEFGEALLTVRDVLDKESNKQLGVIVSEAGEIPDKDTVELTEKQKEYLENDLAVVSVPEGSKISVNGKDSLGIIDISQTALLFDDILYYNILNEDTGNLVLVDRMAETLKDMGKQMEGRKYQSKYLDLVQDQDGNLWVSSSKGSVVTWPYPEGTDENTDFDLFHYRGLHREYGIKGNAEESEAVYTAPQEKVRIEKTKYGIQFFIPESGFSPFVLSWTDKNADEKPDSGHGKDEGDMDKGNPVQNIIHTVKTGDTAAAGILFAGVWGSVVLIAVLWKKRK